MRDNIVKTVLVLTLLVWTGIAMGQSVVPPTPNDSILTPEVGSQGVPLEVCPGEATKFGVPINQVDAGDISLNKFEWIVYGGTITSYNGTLVADSETKDLATSTTYTNHSLTTTGINIADDLNSEISITWDTDILASTEQPFIAVRQIPESTCDENWSVYYIEFNKPTLTCPEDISGTCATQHTIPSTTTTNVCRTGSFSLNWDIYSQEVLHLMPLVV